MPSKRSLFFRDENKRELDGLYDALEKARPLAEKLLKRIRTNALVVGGVFAAATVGLAWVLSRTSVPWLGLLVAPLAWLAAYCPTAFLKLGKALNLALYDQVRWAQIAGSDATKVVNELKDVSRGVRSLLWNPLSLAEQSFLDEYVAMRSLITSLEAYFLRIHLEGARRPLFDSFKDRVQMVLADALQQLVAGGRLSDPAAQRDVLESEVRRLGLQDLINGKASDFWTFDYAAAGKDNVPFEGLVGALLGIGEHRIEIQDLLKYRSKSPPPSTGLVGART
jgi:hypothetical protein